MQPAVVMSLDADEEEVTFSTVADTAPPQPYLQYDQDDGGGGDRAGGGGMGDVIGGGNLKNLNFYCHLMSERGREVGVLRVMLLGVI